MELEQSILDRVHGEIAGRRDRSLEGRFQNVVETVSRVQGDSDPGRRRFSLHAQVQTFREVRRG